MGLFNSWLSSGFPLSGAIWHEQQRLSDRYRVITPDLRGHGRSPAPSLGFHAPQEAARILAEAIDLARQGRVGVLKAVSGR